jgi:hypothetical protein
MHRFINILILFPYIKGVKMSKKGQITVFIVIGIVILASVGAFIYLRSIASREAVSPEAGQQVALPTVTNAESLKEYIESCIQKVSEEPIKTMAKQGSTLYLDNSKLYSGNKYRYLCLLKPGYNSCVNIIPNRQSMEFELSSIISSKLRTCIRLEQFQKMGYEISQGTMKVIPSIRVDDVVINVNYPITLAKGDDRIEVSNFSSALELPLGKLYELAVQIINYESINGFFDQDNWMTEHKNEIQIEKHRPYPDIIYKLTKKIKPKDENFEFYFALQGRDTTADIGKPSPAPDNTGCCKNKYDNTCFASSEQATCSKVQGATFDNTADCNCAGLVFYDYKTQTLSCGNHECKDCGDKKNGESWCVYEGSTGNGFDYVGSRHYKQSCIDGVTYTEECRDYREELCTAVSVNGIGKALCRINRWQDCSAKSSSGSCEDKNNRDCKWLGYLHNSIKSYGLQRGNRGCVPEVPPGFKFWQGQGSIVCDMANEYRDCDGTNCPMAWVDANAIYCSSLGDCGNKKSVAGYINKNSFFNSNHNERPYVYEGTSNLLGLPLAAREHPMYSGNEFNNAGYTRQDIMRAANEYMQEASSWDAEDFMWEYLRDKKVSFYIFAASLCSPWQAPGGGSCNQCETSLACSEYKCKSLGKSCNYYEENGIGKCSAAASEDKTPPKLSFDAASLIDPYKSNDMIFMDYKGVQITPAIKPLKTVNVIVKTDEPAQCTASPYPIQGDATIAPMLSLFTTGLAAEPNFSTIHKISLIIPPLEELNQRLNESIRILNMTNPSQLYYLANNYSGTVQQFGTRYGVPQEEIQPSIEAYNSAMTLFDSNALKQMIISNSARIYRLFVRCNDFAGNENKDYFFVQFSVSEKEEDNEPPKIINSTPQNGEYAEDRQLLTVLTDEFAECRYDFSDKPYEEMGYEMQCPVSEFFTTATGLYECTSQLNTSSYNKNDIINTFIRCKDNPLRYETYSVTLTGSDNLELQDRAFRDQISIRSNVIEAKPSSVLNGIRFAVNQDIILKFAVKDNSECMYEQEKSSCSTINNQTVCEQILKSPAKDKTKTYAIKCFEEKKRNVNENSYTLSLIKK